MVGIVLGATLLGMVSSLHCVGMCGPIALGLPTRDLASWQRNLAQALYHAGRISTYALFGLIFGWLGRRVYLSGWQQGFSILLGLVMAVILGQYLGFGRALQPGLLKKAYTRLQTLMIRAWNFPSLGKYYLIGLANGLLPCGMVYAATAGALSTGSLGGSVLFMTLFGAGTLPALVGLRHFAAALHLDNRKFLRNMTPYFLGLMAIILILRGLNLGLPFLSPVLPQSAGSPVSCH